MEAQKTQNRQSSLEKKKNKKEDFNLLQSSSSIKNIYMVLAQKQTYRTMEQNRKPRIAHTYTIN